MSTRNALALSTLLTLLGCADDLEKASQLKHFRLFGARIDNVTRRESDPRSAEAAPDETVRVSLRAEDPLGMGRSVQTVWVFCPQISRVGSSFGCDPRAPGFSVMMGTDVEYRIPRIMYGTDRSGRAVIQALALSCAGGTIALGAGGLPTCTGQGAESWAMTRSVTVRTDETSPMNHNPEITSVVMYRSDVPNAPEIALTADGSASVPRCAASACPSYYVEIRTIAGARETYPRVTTSGAFESTLERILFSFAATAGDFDLGFYVDTAERPSATPRVLWTAPTTAGPVKMVLSSLDPRGGFDSVTRNFNVQ